MHQGWQGRWLRLSAQLLAGLLMSVLEPQLYSGRAHMQVPGPHSVGGYWNIFLFPLLLRGSQVAFDGVGSMPMARIREVRSEKQAVVDVELARRGRNRAVHDAVRDSDRHAPFAAEGTRTDVPGSPPVVVAASILCSQIKLLCPVRALSPSVGEYMAHVSVVQKWCMGMAWPGMPDWKQKASRETMFD